MHPQIRNIKKELAKLPEYHQKIAFLENKFEGEDCYILAPGPSLGHINGDTLMETLKGNLTLSVKQAYTKYKKVSDFHFINDCNLPGQGYPGYFYNLKKGPIVIASSGYPEEYAKTRFALNQHWDIFCKVIDPQVYPGKNYGRLCENFEFERGLFTNMLDRPCGPSITLETVIYTAVHLGIKNIYAIGWDSGAKVGEHFYKEKTSLTSNRNFEYELVQEGSGPLYEWLQNKNINLYLISEVSALSEQIPRTTLESIV